jgi:peptidoglycan/LPS O-acetylase OafA/YrhL
VDGLRGICALLVLYGHAFAPLPVVDPNYSPSATFYWFNLGSAAVMMFFVLSGYVIGLTVRGPANRYKIARYGRRRAVRLVPITYAAIFLTWLLSGQSGGRLIGGHLLFLQNDTSYPLLGKLPLFSFNQNLWSLHYEAVYYVLFVAAWWMAPPIAPLGILLLLLGLSPCFGWPVSPLVPRYACGALFWLGGLCLAWGTKREVSGESDNIRTNWPSAFLAAYAVWIFGPLRLLFLRHGIGDLRLPNPVLPHRLDFLPLCLWVVLAVSARNGSLRRFLTIAGLALGWVGVAANAMVGGWSGEHTIATIALAIATMGAKREYPVWALARMAPIGGISFAIYVFAEPIQLAQRALLPGFSGTAVTYASRLMVVIVTIFGLSWLMEHRLQPWLAARLRGRR